MFGRKLRIALVFVSLAAAAAAAHNWQGVRAGDNSLVSHMTNGILGSALFGSKQELSPAGSEPRREQPIGPATTAVVASTAPCVPNQKTWDGEGTTNNWSEAANWTCDLVPLSTDDVFFDGTSTKDATININVTAQVFRMNAGYTGTITQGSSNLTVIGGITQSAGTFIGGSGTIVSSPGTLTLNGGVFNAGNSTIQTGGAVTVTAASTFNADSGTVTFEVGGGGGPVNVDSAANPGALLFNNIRINRGGFSLQVQSGTLIALGTVELVTGGIQGGTIEARGNVTIAPTFTQGSSSTGGILAITGAATRTVTIPGGVVMPGLTLNAPNVTVNTSGTGTIRFKELVRLQDGTIDQGSVGFLLFTNSDSSILQSGGTFNGGSGTFTGGVEISGGTFNGGSGVIDCNIAFSITGGTFNGGSSTLQTSAAFTVSSGAVFNPQTGKIVFDGSGSTVTLNPTASPNSLTVNNVEINRGGSPIELQSTQKLIVAGLLELTSGGIQNGTVEALGDVTLGNSFNAGLNGKLRFAGTVNQTFTNLNNTPFGDFFLSIAIDKSPLSTVTANGGIFLSVGSFPGTLNITSGTLYLNNNSNITTGSMNIDANGRLVSESATTILLKGSVVNNGVIDLQGGGAACDETPGVDPISIRSVSGQRPWTGSGRYRLVDVDVQNMGGTGTKTVFSGTNTGGNNTSWVFNSGCPTAVSITPSIVGVQTGQTQQFAAGGTFPPFVFSLLTNNSGGSINAGGLYTAGAIAGVTDTVRVTDAFGGTADATVSTFGPASKLTFTAQPTNTVAGQTISSVQVAVQDANGNTVTSSSAPITLSIANNPNGGTLFGATAPTINGIATFSNLSINRAGIGYTLQAASGSLTSATSDSFNIAVGIASQLVIIDQPVTTFAENQIVPVSVAVQDASGNTVPTAADSITIAIGNNPSGGTLSGVLTRNAVNGGVVFSGLAIDNLGVGYTLVATSGSLTSATSVPFDIISPFIVTNTNDSGLGSLRQAILNSNSTPGTQTISFNIPGPGPFKIAVNSELPAITSPASIDGTTQPGFAGTPIIELSGENVASGIRGLRFIYSPGPSSGGMIKGLAINRFQGSGISLNSPGVTIEGNHIGTDPTGTIGRGNGTGIAISIGNGSIIRGNILSGNLFGITVSRSVSNTLIENNLIGIGSDGTALGNTLVGIRMDIPVPNLSNGNLITTNRINFNGGLGISLDGRPSALPNDPMDVDSGANLLQNYPVLTSAVSFGASTNIAGTFNSTPSQTYTLEFFSSAACDPSGFGEGDTYIGSSSVSTDAGGIAAVTANFAVSTAVGRVITATATDANGNTSEFSRCQTVAAATFSISGRIADPANAPLSGISLKIPGAPSRAAVTDTNGNYSFGNLPAGGNYTVTATTRNVTFAPTNRIFNNLSANQTGQDFVGTRVSTIRGKVQSSVNGITFPLSGVTITLTGAADRTTVTNNNGDYKFVSIPTGNYTVTPTRDSFTFTPVSASTSLSTATQLVNFSAQGTNAGGRIYFDDIKAMNSDGSGEMSISTPIRARDLDVSSDGRKIVFSRRVGGGDAVVISDFDGTDMRTIISPPPPPPNPTQGELFFSLISSPVWSPTGDRIAFISTNKIEIANSDGTNRTVINSNGNAPFGRPSLDWSSDGTKLVFNKDNNIFSIGSTGSDLLQLTTTGGFEPNFSPDGTKIAYTKSTGVFLMNADGTNQVILLSGNGIQECKWSPDGNFLAFRRVNGASVELMRINSDGSGLTLIRSGFMNDFAWARDVASITSIGSNVNVALGSSSIIFSNVTSNGVTTITPISPDSAGMLPGGFIVGGEAYEISTTAVVSPPIGLCFTVPSNTPAIRFGAMFIFHNENGTLVNRTTFRDFATRQLCGSVGSLSPFVIAEQIDTNLPSISGVVVDSNGDPMSGVSMSLTGTDSRTTETDSDGVFRFVNLTPNGNYNVSPKQVGYLFDEYNTNFVNITGEETVVFEGTQSNFQVSGQVVDGSGVGVSGVTVEIDGAAQNSVQTDSNGNYTFTDLPADGFYTVTPFDGVNAFTPNSATVDPLTSDAAGVDFQMFAPTAANASIAGRILTANGQGVRNVIIQLTSAAGETKYARSSSFGYYKFEDLPVGEIYILSVSSKKYTIASPTRVINLNEDLTAEDFIAEESR